MKTYVVEVRIEVKIAADADEETAFSEVDEIMQRAWDNDARLGELRPGPDWHFEMLEGAVTGEMESSP